MRKLVANIYVRVLMVLINIMPGYPNQVFNQKFKRFLCRMCKWRIGPQCTISPGIYIHHIGNLKMGSGCSLGYFFNMWNHAEIIIGNNLLASHGIKIICGSHSLDSSYTAYSGSVVIGDNVWIGANVVIVGPCIIGDNVIIGANSFVNNNLKNNVIYGGSPVRNIGCR